MTLLWLWTMAASDAPWLVATTFWVVVGSGLAWWVHRSMQTDARQFHAMAGDLESALRRNAADVYDVRATAFVDVEEVEDEGACYGFALPDDRIVFVAGQEFYESARFPSLDFSLVYVLDERDRSVDMFLDSRGARATAERTIPAKARGALAPRHLQVLNGHLDQIESLLAGESRSAS